MGMKTVKKLAIVLFILVFLILAHQIETNEIEVNEITVYSSDLPYEFNGTKIALVGDFHYGEFCSEDKVQEAVKLTNEQNPDIIVLIGDYVTDDASNLEPCFRILSNLSAPYGFMLLQEIMILLNQQKLLF